MVTHVHATNGHLNTSWSMPLSQEFDQQEEKTWGACKSHQQGIQVLTYLYWLQFTILRCRIWLTTPTWRTPAITRVAWALMLCQSQIRPSSTLQLVMMASLVPKWGSIIHSLAQCFVLQNFLSNTTRIQLNFFFCDLVVLILLQVKEKNPSWVAEGDCSIVAHLPVSREQSRWRLWP